MTHQPPFPPTAEQLDREVEDFINSIHPDDVCKLASRHNSSKACRMFQNPANGSYNVCYFVKFEDGTRWVVRIPLEPTVFNVWDKVQSEVVTIRYLRTKTTIPVLEIHAFGRGGTVDEENPTGYAYIIESFISGQSLDIVAFGKDYSPEQRVHFYSELIDILAQLRHQEFAYAGSLMPDPDGGASPIIGPLLSLQQNDLPQIIC